MKNVIVGMGEVGSALFNILGPDAIGIDKRYQYTVNPSMKYEVLHICFPYSDKFMLEVAEYRNKFNPSIVIVHSSVPIGTCEVLDAVHSPIRGVHPNLEQGIRTFVKYFGGFKAPQAARIFKDKGIDVKVISDSRTTEALKLWDTTQYGVMILLEKEIHKFCRDNGLDFHVVYSSANATYNQGYHTLDMPYVNRPHLMHKDGKIGGHCVVENAALLDTPLAKMIIERNTQLDG